MFQPYLLFLKKLILFLGIVFMADRLGGFLLRRAVLHEPQGETSITTHLLEQGKEDILIFGSSRASHHYHSAYLQSQTGYSVFNGGKDGINVIYSNAILPVILHRYQPKLIVLDVNPNELSWKAGQEGRDIVNSALAPFISYHPEINSYFSKQENTEYWKSQLSWLYRYNSLPASLLQHYLHVGQRAEQGYLPLTGTMLKPEMKTESALSNPTDSFIVAGLKEFVNRLKEKNIPLIVFISPSTMKLENYASLQPMIQIFKENNVSFHNFLMDTAFADKSLFYDMDHLNTTGVDKYNQALLPLLRNAILPNKNH